MQDTRPHCYTCDKPAPQCICADIPRVPNRTRVVLLQHPRERRHPVGSARLARLGLSRVHFEVCWDLQASDEARAFAQPERCGILFPSDDATLIEGPLPNLDNLFVIDGTWTQAKSMVKQNPWMQDVPHYAIRPDGVDRYRIRREPKAQYTSTIEAIIAALTQLEPHTPKLDALLQSFNTLIERQVQSIKTERKGSRRRARPHVQHGCIPPQFTEALQDNMVVVYPEFTYQRVPHVPVQRQLIYWTALHLRTREVFHQVVKPTQFIPTEEHLRHIGLAPHHLDDGCTLEALRKAWRTFCAPGTHVAGWNQASLDLLRADIDDESQAWLLKALYCNQQRGQSGHLEEVVAKHDLSAQAVPGVWGRAAQRLGNAVAIAQALRERDALAPPRDHCGMSSRRSKLTSVSTSSPSTRMPLGPTSTGVPAV